jgi:Protein of unknown function (DUF3467)
MAQSEKKEEVAVQPAARAADQQVKVRWNTQNLKSSYANFANATTTREEVVLNFGVNLNWDRSMADQEVAIDLEHRIVLSPFAAKRLQDLLGRLMKEYEQRYGELRG